MDTMIEQVFHVYKKNMTQTEVVAHSLTVDELEAGLIDHVYDFKKHDIQSCCPDYDVNNASY
jgi:hypothetical protein